jgi:hypothetical protein
VVFDETTNPACLPKGPSPGVGLWVVQGAKVRRRSWLGETELGREFARFVGEVEADVFERYPGGKYGLHGAAVEQL